MYDPTTFVQPTFDDGTELWTPLSYEPLFLLDSGITSRAFNPDAIAMLTDVKNVLFQEMSVGFPMRIWIEGLGGLAGVSTDNTALEERDETAIRASIAANDATAFSRTSIRTGTREAWDTQTIFPVTDFPPPPVAKGLHTADPATKMRLNFAKSWLEEWARTVYLIDPFGPIILEGVILGAGFTPASSGDNGQKAQFFIREAMAVGRNEWLSYEQIVALGLPVEPGVEIDTSTPDAFQISVWQRNSILSPWDLQAIDGILVRPSESIDRRRYVLYRSTIHPYFRREA